MLVEAPTLVRRHESHYNADPEVGGPAKASKCKVGMNGLLIGKKLFQMPSVSSPWDFVFSFPKKVATDRDHQLSPFVTEQSVQPSAVISFARQCSWPAQVVVCLFLGRVQCL